MEKIIGREQELSLLAKYQKSNHAEFIAIYGRRRVGKTFLVNGYFQGQFDFYVTGIIGGTHTEELGVFNTALKDYGYTGTKATTWMEAFNALAMLLKEKSIAQNRRCVVFIDELPCFDTRNSGFIHALDHFWNSKGTWIDNLMLIVCGSATSWMIRKVINNRGGLHNRVTHEIHLKPFDLYQTEQYMLAKKCPWDRMSILQAYMILGGVPYYLSLLDFDFGLPDNIDKLFFYEDAEMRREYRLLFQSLYKNSDVYISIVKLLSEHKKGLTRKEIAEKLKFQNNGHLGDVLDDLIYCDFIRQYDNGKKINNGIYQLMDFYTFFYNQFCRRNSMDEHYWRNTLGTPTQNTWYGLAFERVCLSHYRHIIFALRLDSIHTEFYSWRSRKSTPAVQIDLVIDRSDRMITLGEVKYSTGPYTLSKQEHEKIQNRISTFVEETKCTKGVQSIIITTIGLKNNIYSDISHRTITLEDLFTILPN